MHRAALIALALIAPAVLAGCTGAAPTAGTDDLPAAAPTATPWARPIPDAISGLAAVGRAAGVQAAAGLWTHGDHAYVGGVNTGFHVVNLTTPESPRVVGHVDGFYARDVDLIHYGDGRTVAVVASSGDGMRFIDVTDPAAPEVVGHVDGFNVHNVAVVPGTAIVYNSRSVSAEQLVDVVDATDPANPQVLEPVDHATTCHDITFYTAGARAYCAGIQETQIWDITDPTRPALVSRVVNPAINIHHWAATTHNGTLLVIGDEFAGSTAVAAGCYAHHDTPAGAASDPVGAVWFYDITDEQNPVPLSWVAPDVPADNAPPAPCTAHFGTFVPGHDKMVVGWRAAGTHLVDFQDPAKPRLLAGVVGTGDAWDARIHNGYVFTGDSAQGLEVLTFEAPGDA